MKLHRLQLRNFRGVTDREVTFPDSGVVILQGENEVGKTTMIEAFDLLLDKADSSKAAQVRSVQPAGQDVAPSVEAEFSTGEYHLTYRKQWLRSPRTELHVSSPHGRHLTGGQAHEEVLRILAETLDTSLFKALRVLQTGARSPADLSDSAALSAALDRAAGSAGHDEDGEALLQRVAEEYARYFTPTGRPTGELAAAEKDLQAAEETFATADQGLQQLQQDVDKHAELSGELAQIEEALTRAERQAEQDEREWQELVRLREELDRADQAVQLHTSERRLHAGAARRRSEQEEQLSAKQAELDELDAARTDVVDQLQAAGRARENAESTLTQAREAEGDCRDEVDRAARAVEAHHDRAEEERLAEVIRAVQAQQEVIEDCRGRLADTQLDDDLLDQVDQAHEQVTIMRTRHESAAARIRLDALGTTEVVVDGTTRHLEVPDRLDLPVTDKVSLEIPEVVHMAIEPATSTDSTTWDLAQARNRLSDLLATAGAEDRADAHRRFDAEQAVRARLDHAEDRVNQLLADRTIGDLRATHAEVRARIGADDAAPTGEQADLPGLRGAKETADEGYSSAQQHTIEAETALREASDWYASLQAKSTRIQAQHDGLTDDIRQRAEHLAQERQDTPDAQLRQRADAAAEALESAETGLASLTEELAGVAAEQVDAARENSQQLLRRLGAEREDLREQVRQMTASLRVRGRQGLQEDYDTALSSAAAARRAHERVQRRAQACAVLHTTLHRARDAARAQYVRPFREQVLGLGRVVYGPGFDVEIGEDLQIRTRTLDDVTIDFEMLSAGAQEQLGIITRLACAAVVDPEQGVPVIIDDALGYSDPRRLAAMNTMIGTLSGDAQIILLTCTPERYRGIGSASVVRVEATSDALP